MSDAVNGSNTVGSTPTSTRNANAKPPHVRSRSSPSFRLPGHEQCYQERDIAAVNVPRTEHEGIHNLSQRLHATNRRNVASSCLLSPEDSWIYVFHPPSESDPPPLDEGRLRFRVTHSSDPASFADGKDLLNPDSTPWTLQAGRMENSARQRAIARRILLEDGLVSETQLDEWNARYGGSGHRWGVLHNLETPSIPLVQGRRWPRWSLCDGPVPFRFLWDLAPDGLLTDRDAPGMGICRYEDVGVRAKYGGRPKLVMRLEKALEPASYGRNGSGAACRHSGRSRRQKRKRTVHRPNLFDGRAAAGYL